MKVYLDKPNVMKMRNDTKALSFTVIFVEDEDVIAIIPYFRLMDGILHAPANYSKTSKKYYQGSFFSTEVAEKIYETVNFNNWVKIYELPALKPLDEAVEKLVITYNTTHAVAPSLKKMVSACES